MARQEEATLLLKIKTAGEAALDKTVSALKEIAKIAATAFAALGGALAYSIKQYREEEEAVNSLNTAMAQQGIYSKALSDEYRKTATELQRLTTFGDEQIIQAQAVIQGQIGQERVTKELTKATLDLAQAQGISLEAAASMVGKSIGTSTNALARQGIEVDANASKSEKLAQVIDGLNAKFGGQAEAAASGLGALQQTGNLISDLAETVGKIAAPYLLYFNKQFQGLINKLQESPAAFETVTNVVQFFAKSIAVGINLVQLLGAFWGTTFGFIATTINQISEQGLGAFKSMGDNVALLFEEQKANLLTAKTNLETDFANIDSLGKANIEKKQDEHFQKMSAKRAADLQNEKLYNKQREENQRSTFSTIATLAQSNNSTLAAIGKAAGITQIAIDTPVAISKAMAAFPPPFNFVAAGLVGTAMAAQAARIAGVQLAEGGIVMPRPGGTQATIGEAGQAEAVIPLDRAGEFGLGGGGGTTIIFQGPVLGDDSQARAFAEKIDVELYKLRKSNSSVAFDSGLV